MRCAVQDLGTDAATCAIARPLPVLGMCAGKANHGREGRALMNMGDGICIVLIQEGSG